MKSLKETINEKLKIKKSSIKYKPTNIDELNAAIKSILDNLNDKTYLDLNEIDTSEMTTFGEVLANLKETVSIDISKWDSSKVTNMEFMFADCKNLETIYIGNWDLSKVTNMSSMFSRCFKLKEIVGIEQWDMSNVENISSMFYGCKEFNQNISNWNTNNIKSKHRWFKGSGLMFKNVPDNLKY